MNCIVGAGARLSVRLLVAALLALSWSGSAHAQLPTTWFTAKESGAEPNPSVELEIPLSGFVRMLSLTAPSGEVFQSTQNISFSTLDAAFDFLEGTWHGAYDPRFPANSPPQDFEFTIASISTDSVYRGVPTEISLEHGAKVRSGETFLLSWDYDSVEPVHQTYLRVAGEINGFDFSPEAIVSKPRIGSSSRVSGSSSVGSDGLSASFGRTFASEPGADQNRFLTTLTGGGSGSPLPADFSLTIGAANILSVVTNQPDNDANPFNGPPAIGLRYLRVGEPIEFQLVAVPEPASWALVLSFAMTGIHALRRRLVVS